MKKLIETVDREEVSHITFDREYINRHPEKLMETVDMLSANHYLVWISACDSVCVEISFVLHMEDMDDNRIYCGVPVEDVEVCGD